MKVVTAIDELAEPYEYVEHKILHSRLHPRKRHRLYVLQPPAF
jgi:hypothetical protein